MLRLNVQTDRLPDIASGATSHIAIRVSAAAAGADTTALDRKDVKEVTPWHWRSSDGTTGWKPHLPASWTIWRIATTGDADAVPLAALEPVVGDVLPEFVSELESQIEKDIDRLVASAGAERAIAWPGDGTPVLDRTVFGLLESLTGMPHPTAAAMRVFTLLAIDTAKFKIAATDRFIAAPVFKSASGGNFNPYGAPAPASSTNREGNWTVALVPTAPQPPFPSGEVHMRPSWSAAELPPPKGSGRLVDLETMLIGKPATGAVLDEDWLSNLPARIAETIDPAACVLAMLDPVVSSADETTRQALAKDLRTDRKFLRVLDAVHWSVLSSRIVSSPARPAPAPSIVDGLAFTDGTLWPAALHLVLGQADRELFLTRIPPRATFSAVSARRVASLVDLPLDELEKFVEASSTVTTRPGDAPSLETEGGFTTWLLSHWLVEDPVVRSAFAHDVKEPHPLPLAKGSIRAYAGQELVVRNEEVTASASEVPLVDFRRVQTLGAGVRTITIPFRIHRDAAASQHLRVSLIARAGTTSRFDIDLKTDKGTGSLGVTGLASPVALTDVSADVAFTVTITVERLQAGGAARIRITAAIKVGGGAKQAADIAPQTADGLYAGPVTVTIEAVDGDFQCAGVELERLSTREFRAALQRLPPDGLRRNLALAFAGRFLPGLLAGREVWDTPWKPPAGDARPIGERLRTSIAALVKKLYAEEMAAAIKVAELTDTTLKELVARIVDAAMADARRRANALVPAGAEELVSAAPPPIDRLSVDARPLVFRIDQLQSFVAGEDIWSRLAGLGVLMARTAKLSDVPADWRSLSVATFHVPKVVNGVREDLSKNNALKVRAAEFPGGSVVDPVPYQVTEDSGIRSVLIAYENRSIVGEMPTDARTAATDTPEVVRRVEAYGFPPKSNWRVPTLSFGYAYHVVPYVVGHGGGLPPALRKSEASPLEINEIVRDEQGVKQAFVEAKTSDAFKDATRSAMYRRTRPVGAPRLGEAGKLPGVPPDVAPLAGEIPIRPAPLTLRPGTPLRFFLDKEGRRGILDMPASALTVGIRIDSLLHAAGSGGSTELTFRIGGRATPESAVSTLLASKPMPIANGRVRLELFPSGAQVGTAPEPALCEDEPDFSVVKIEDPALQTMATWSEMWLEFSAAAEADIEPPLLSIVTRATLDGASSVFAKPMLAPEASHHTREIAVIDGITPASGAWPRAFRITVRRPTVEFGTYERWINPPLFEKAISDASRQTVARAIDAAHERTSASPSDRGDRTLDDPAVTRMFVELVQIFPKYGPVGTMVPLGEAFTKLEDIINNDGASARRAAVDVREGPKAELKQVSGGAQVTCIAGRVYELRVYGGVPKEQSAICALPAFSRLSDAVHSLLRTCPVDPSMVLGAPLTLTIEVSTGEMPVIAQGMSARELIAAQLERPPTTPEDWALMRLDTGLLPHDPATYASIRYVDRAALLSQRWTWRGRPQEDAWPEVTERDETVIGRLFDTAFLDRSHDDVGDIIERGLTAAHVYAGRTKISPVPKGRVPSGPYLFQKNLDYRTGVNLWRFAWRLTSRYLAMRPNNAGLVLFTHRRGRQTSRPDWLNVVVPERPARRVPKRPGLAIMVPLTEPLMTNGAVPPLLALFREQMFAGFHAGDGIEAAVEMARHPFNRKDIDARIAEHRKNGEIAEAEALERALPSYPAPDDPRAALRYWQERGPDPIRSGRSADGQPIALRVDGPLGYTMDLETAGGRFDHAGLLISPVGAKMEQVEPWSMLKLRFRRHEAPEGIDPQLGMAAEGWVPANVHKFQLGAPRSLESGSRYRLANNSTISAVSGPSEAELVTAGDGTPGKNLQIGPKTLQYDKILVFPVDHEGLIVDLPGVSGAGAVVVEARFGVHTNADFVQVTVSVGTEGPSTTLTISAKTGLGDAGTWQQKFSELARPAVRLVLSARDKPEQGEKYKPVGDVVVRTRFTRDDISDALRDPAENRWLSVLTVPLTSAMDMAIADPVVVHLSGQWPVATTKIRPVRLSTFTPSVWCQFAESMSVFRARIRGSADETLVGCAELATSLSGSVLEVRLSDENGGKLESLAPLGDLQPKDGAKPSQLEEVMFLIVTQYVTDVFDLLRERPVAVLPWNMTAVAIDLKTTVWPIAATPVDLKGKSGRVRFVRMLRSRAKVSGGFEDAQDVSPTNLFEHAMFGDPGAVQIDMNPLDARGMVLGVSAPIEWTG
jgi:hypothetical protein